MQELELDGFTLFPYGVYIGELSSLVFADFHLGLERAMEEEGLYLPYRQFPEVAGIIRKAIDRYDVKNIILLGDVKHEFGRASDQEWGEVLSLLKELRGHKVRVVRGNHDNYLIPILKREGVELDDPYLDMGNYRFAHGHIDVPLDRNLVMGHEHPAISIRDDFGASVTYKCALYRRKEPKILVLPAMVRLGYGKDILLSPREELISPILRRTGIDDMEVIVVDEEVGVSDLGSVNDLRRLMR
jgi:putative SbcD/Mre11-related phosphoesterase